MEKFVALLTLFYICTSRYHRYHCLVVAIRDICRYIYIYIDSYCLLCTELSFCHSCSRGAVRSIRYDVGSRQNSRYENYIYLN